MVEIVAAIKSEKSLFLVFNLCIIKVNIEKERKNMKLEKRQIGVHLINWVSAGLLFILFFFKSLMGESIWSLAESNSMIFVLLILPLVLAGLGFVKIIDDKIIHLGWIILSSMTLVMLFFMQQLASSFGSLSQMLGGGSGVGFTFYLILLIYLILLVYNSMAILDKADKIQRSLGEKTGPTLSSLGSKAKEMGSNIKEKASDLRQDANDVEAKPHLESEPRTVEIKPEDPVDN